MDDEDLDAPAVVACQPPLARMVGLIRRCAHCHMPLHMRRGGQEYTRCPGCNRWLHRDTKRHVRVFGSCYQSHGAQCLSRPLSALRGSRAA